MINFEEKIREITKDRSALVTKLEGGNSFVYKVTGVNNAPDSVFKFITSTNPQKDLHNELFFFQGLNNANLPVINIITSGSDDELFYYQMPFIEQKASADDISTISIVAKQLTKLHKIRGNGFGKITLKKMMHQENLIIYMIL